MTGTFFKDLKIGDRFVANQWGDRQDHTFVKRDVKTATHADYFDAKGHPTRGWVARTQFRARDVVTLVGKFSD